MLCLSYTWIVDMNSSTFSPYIWAYCDTISYEEKIWIFPVTWSSLGFLSVPLYPPQNNEMKGGDFKRRCTVCVIFVQYLDNPMNFVLQDVFIGVGTVPEISVVFQLGETKVLGNIHLADWVTRNISCTYPLQGSNQSCISERSVPWSLHQLDN